MRNLSSLLLTLLWVISISTIVNAQPKLSVWRVAEDHQDNHEHIPSADDKIEYDCGAYYYMSHTGEQIDMYFALRNDGNKDLDLQLPIEMSVLSSKFLEVTSDASASTLAPGEETMITISYLNTGDYVPGQRGVITFKSNDFINPFCGFSIEVGQPNPDPVDSYCVCEEGNLVTLTEMMDGGPGAQDGIILPIQPNQFKLHPGPCDPMEDECPAEESLSCYYTEFLPNFRTAIAGNQAEAMAPSAAPVYLEVSSGYCPCIIETDFCIERTDDLPSLDVDECVGDPRTYEVYNCWEDDFVQDHGDLTLPEGYNYEWCTDGVGTFSDKTGLDAIIEGWFPQDILFVKVTNEEGCIGVRSIFLNGGNGYSLPIRLQNEPPVCIQDELILCLEVDPALKRDAINKRSDNVIWSTNGEGVFSNPTYMEGNHCITISGMKFGDRVYAVDHASNGALVPPGECPPYGVYNSTFQGPYPCTEALENVGLGGISLDDPCNCGDPLNIPPPIQGVTEFFHDVMTIENLDPFEDVTIIPIDNFLDNTGTPIILPFGRTADMWGRIEADFWHAPGIPAIANIEPDDSDPTTFTSSVCEPCIPIPTLSQWAIIILGMMMFIIGLVFIRQNVTAERYS